MEGSSDSYRDTFEGYRDEAREWRWRRKAHGNNEEVADSGEGYENKQDAVQAIAREFGVEVEDLNIYDAKSGAAFRVTTKRADEERAAEANES